MLFEDGSLAFECVSPCPKHGSFPVVVLGAVIGAITEVCVSL